MPYFSVPPRLTAGSAFTPAGIDSGAAAAGFVAGAGFLACAKAVPGNSRLAALAPFRKVRRVTCSRMKASSGQIRRRRIARLLSSDGPPLRDGPGVLDLASAPAVVLVDHL